MTTALSSSVTSPAPSALHKRSRTIARVAAVQVLFQCEQAGQNAETVLTEFICHRHTASNAQFEDGHMPNADLNLLKKTVGTVALKQDAIDKALAELLPENWPLKRLDPVLRALLRAAFGEMSTDIPTQIIINEYIDVAHGFFSGEEPKMVNAILDNFAQHGRKLV